MLAGFFRTNSKTVSLVVFTSSEFKSLPAAVRFFASTGAAQKKESATSQRKVGHRGGGSRPAIAHGHDLHVLDGLESGDMTQAGIGARADQTYAENLTCHVYFSP